MSRRPRARWSLSPAAIVGRPPAELAAVKLITATCFTAGSAGADSQRRPNHSPAAARPTSAATAAAHNGRRTAMARRGPPGRPTGADSSSVSIDPWRAKARSRADWKRSSGRFSRQCLTTAFIGAGTALGSGFGSAERIAAMVSAELSRWNARRPATIS